MQSLCTAQEAPITRDDLTRKILAAKRPETHRRRSTATGLASLRVAYAIAAIFAVMDFLPMISVALASMPRQVMGGIALFFGCLVMINGLQTMASCRMDQRRTVVLGLGLNAGLAAEKYPQLALGMPA